MNQFGSYILLGLAMFKVSVMIVVFELSRPVMTFVVLGYLHTTPDSFLYGHEV